MLDVIFKWLQVAEFDAGVSIYRAAERLLEIAQYNYAEDSRYNVPVKGLFNDTLIYATVYDDVQSIVERYFDTRG